MRATGFALRGVNAGRPFGAQAVRVFTRLRDADH
jgi:hypothetical protein